MRSMLRTERNTLLKDTGAETAVTHMIFFIAAMVLAISVVVLISGNVQSMIASSSASSKILSEQMRTDITIVNDPEIIPYDGGSGKYTFYAKNTGKTELAPEYVTVLVDGIFIEPVDVNAALTDGDIVWRPGEILTLNVTTTPSPLEAGDHRVLVAADNGKSGAMNFKT
ncbi:MAG: archaeal flagellar protein FlaG [Methanolobus sp.]|jgi:flagellar protein FlaG|uniref:Putative archaeal flagellar protein G n=1 Tax=Methanolobus tindarius DSM 2278 TaxID=1090322 RepID=W9DN94_METTI|nr:MULTISPECIES: flagellar protein G [Methanolobus]ETA67474.1 putative archaeal flagellar protein G [Methanolobus tindarius DSM 2278]MDI3486267.1 archaeal flagellar protein FlaG [Methanolobus sp.]MDK2831815.1 archaeal flagellar protein FlaG [Methanolobus sp.]MDK2939308.1 archaeal flagellar protein FlaG [Methanolobus sp.]